MHLPQFEYLAPRTTDELAELLSQHRGKARMIAGGTDILVQLKNRAISPEVMIDIGDLEALQGISEEDGQLVIGAGTKLEVVGNDDRVRERYPALHRAIAAIGSVQVRAMGTIGGNACNASPAADSPPALIVLGAKAVIASKGGRREMPLEEFITGNRETAMEEDEYLESLVVPPPAPNSASRFTPLGKRDGMECDMVNLGVNVALDSGSGKVSQIAIAMGAVGPKPLRAKKAEEILLGRQPDEALVEKAAQAAQEDTQVIDDFRACASYRKEAVKALAQRTLNEALAALKNG